jgi:60 kDa SS-A/Ro ribonucleoprotein
MKYNEMIKPETVENYEGSEAFGISPELELYTAVATAALSDTSYEMTGERIERICQLAGQVSPEFVAKLAVYTRSKMNLRSIPLLLAVELAKTHNGDDLVARMVSKIVLRADEIMELLTCYEMRNPNDKSNKKLGHLSRQIQNGLAKAFNNFDEYQFAKYDNGSREVKLRDALFLVHPKAKDETQQKIFDKIANKTLETPYTWETELSAAGQEKYDTAEEKETAMSRKWQELIASKKLGYMAMMRNLRNILQCKNMPEEAMNSVIERLTDKEAIEKARQLPFRYLAAYREIAETESPWTSRVMEALEVAAEKTAESITGFDEDTKVLVASDVSGSMFMQISERSKIQNYDIGLMLAMMLKSRCKKVISGIFGETWKQIELPAEHILQNVQELYMREGEVGYSTNGYKVIDWLIANKHIIDKIMIFTDCQMWNSESENHTINKSWHRYKQIAPKAKLYLFDLSGYGAVPLDIKETDVYLIAGWSDKIFDVLAAIDKGSDAIDEINETDI